jgi:hypothetical protein
MMDLKEVKRILADLDYELTLTSERTDWEGLARKAYLVGSALLDRAVEKKPAVKADPECVHPHCQAYGKCSHVYSPPPLVMEPMPPCNSGIEGCTCGGCDCGC